MFQRHTATALGHPLSRTFYHVQKPIPYLALERARIQHYFETHSYQTYIAFYHPFAGQLTAEWELLQRFQKACEKLNYGCFLVVQDVIENTELKGLSIDLLNSSQLCCLISLHFNCPKMSHHFTLMTLWNPRRFHDERAWQRTLSVDGYVSAYSDSIDQQVRMKSDKPFLGHLTTSLDGPLLELGVGRLQCFYCGINWEKPLSKNHRNSLYRKKTLDLLRILDKQNKICIYGPQGAWAGYSSYVGEVAFDGESIVYEINRCGLCLVLSSDPHIEDAVCSNRLFEGLAAGVPIITDKNPFMEKWFGDALFYIDTHSVEIAVGQIDEYITYIQTHPEETMIKLQKCREIFLQHFLMSKQLEMVVEQVQKIKRKGG